jgi:hypothetical protein
MIFGLWSMKNNSNASNMLAVCQNRVRVTEDVYKAALEHDIDSDYPTIFYAQNSVVTTWVCVASNKMS